MHVRLNVKFHRVELDPRALCLAGICFTSCQQCSLLFVLSCCGSFRNIFAMLVNCLRILSQCLHLQVSEYEGSATLRNVDSYQHQPVDRAYTSQKTWIFNNTAVIPRTNLSSLLARDEFSLTYCLRVTDVMCLFYPYFVIQVRTCNTVIPRLTSDPANESFG